MRDADGHYPIEQGYAVTDKADGDHYLMLISQVYQGNVYLINNRMEVKHLGYRMENPALYGTQLDGELVQLKDSPAYTFAAFDCTHVAGRDLRGLPLYLTTANRHQVPSSSGAVEDRQQGLQFVNSQRNLVSLTSSSDGPAGSTSTWSSKEHIFKTDQEPRSILQLVKEVYQPANYGYLLDGVILTPYGDPYPRRVWNRITAGVGGIVC